MKSVIIISLILLNLVFCSEKNIEIIKPKSNEVYRTSDVFDSNEKYDDSFSFFPYLDEFVTYSGWYRKNDKKLTEEENLKEQIKDLKVKLYGKEDVDMKKKVDNNKVYDERWLSKQLKIARILEIEDLLEHEANLASKKL